MKTHSKLRFLKFIPIALAIIALVSLIVMLLWNALIPDIFKGPTITYFQALGLLVLTKILFVFGPRGRPSFSRHSHWRKRMIERWEKMTPEEREEWKKRCGHWRWEEWDKKEETGTEPSKA